MPRIPVHSIDSAPEASREELKSLSARLGMVPNIYGEMAHSPAVINAYVGLRRALTEQGTLDARAAEAIALVVAAVNGCAYCQSAHTLGARAAGLSEEQTIAIREGTFDDEPKLAALLVLVREAAEEAGYVGDSTWQSALDAGWSDEQLVEVVPHIALNVLTNYLNHLVGTEIDLPLAPGLKVGAR